MGGAAPSLIGCGVNDQEASYHMTLLASKLGTLFRDRCIDVVVTHPYEGGHPDHDATAFAVNLARRALVRHGVLPPDLIEMTSYHADTAGNFTTSAFLPGGPAVTVAELPPEDQERKQAMFACFGTQARALKAFQTKRELFRPAPNYDFARAPHSGTLHYERRDWGISGVRWRAPALSASGSTISLASARPPLATCSEKLGLRTRLERGGTMTAASGWRSAIAS